MNFESAVIRALFYDYPIESAVRAIEQWQNNKDTYLAILPHLVRWREQDFTTTEARLMEGIAEDIIYRPFLLVKHIANSLLDCNSLSGQPEVNFNELLRWFDLTRYVGEDLFITAFLADKEKEMPANRQTQTFTWQPYIGHNERLFNHLMEGGMTDLHAHFYASTDVFSLNWLSLMNNPLLTAAQKKRLQLYQDLTLTTIDTEQLFSYERMCIAAAYLRTTLFRVLIKEDPTCVKRLPQTVRILKDQLFAETVKHDLQGEISMLRHDGLHAVNRRTIDYAILPTPQVLAVRNNINLTFHCERQLMYTFLQRFYQQDYNAWHLAPYFYLYILLKTRIRKEFIQCNPLKGFENFETYQDRKGLFIDARSPIGQLYEKYVLQTSVRPHKDGMEGRISPNSIAIRSKNYKGGVFTRQTILQSPNEQLSFVIHFTSVH